MASGENYTLVQVGQSREKNSTLAGQGLDIRYFKSSSRSNAVQSRSYLVFARVVGPLLPHGDADDFFSDNVNKWSFLIRPNEGTI